VAAELRNMSPCLPLLYPADQIHADAVIGSDQAEETTVRSDSDYLISREFGQFVVLSVWRFLSALGISIRDVFRLTSQPQMARIYTSRIIATMQHARRVVALIPCWYWSVLQLIRDAVGQLMSAREPSHTVSASKYAAGPQPATGCLVDLCPKVLGCQFSHVRGSYFTSEAA